MGVMLGYGRQGVGSGGVVEGGRVWGARTRHAHVTRTSTDASPLYQGHMTRDFKWLLKAVFAPPPADYILMNISAPRPV